jgi:predicted porin
LIAAVFRVKQNNGGGSANLFMLGSNYELSKRTLLYASIGTARNSRNSDFSAEVYSNPLPGQNQRSAYFGLSHSF